MQENHTSKVEKTLMALSKYNYIHLGGNELGDGGLKWIAKANWPSLETLRLSLIILIQLKIISIKVVQMHLSMPTFLN